MRTLLLPNDCIAYLTSCHVGREESHDNVLEAIANQLHSKVYKGTSNFIKGFTQLACSQVSFWAGWCWFIVRGKHCWLAKINKRTG